MALPLLAGASIIGYLVNQKQRETNFEEENSVPLTMIADQYAPFNDPQFQNIVGCSGSYPVYNMPGVATSNLGYLNYMNQGLMPYAQQLNSSQINQMIANNEVPGLPLNQQPNHMENYGLAPPDPYSVANNDYLGYPAPVGRNYTLQGYEQGQDARMKQFNHMVAEQNPYSPMYQGNERNKGSLTPNDGKVVEGFANDGSQVETYQTPTLGNGNQLLEDDVNFIPMNDPTSDFLLDLQHRPNTDFSHNNMVPFFGSKVTQNMAGTGVAQGNYIDGVTVDTGYDQTSPHHSRLALYTGNDDAYMHKREAGPMFSPGEQQTGYVFGQPQFRPDESQYTQSLTIKNDMSPVEPEMVGPGLDLDPSIPAAGGLHEYTRVMPNNISDYKANQLEGRVNTGKFVTGAELPTAYPGIGVESDMNGMTRSGPGVPKNRPNTFWTQARYPTMTTRAGGLPNMEYLKAEWDVDFKPNNAMREQTSYGYGNLVPKANQQEGFANVNSGVNYPNSYCLDSSPTVGIMPGVSGQMGSVRAPTFMSQDNNIRSVDDCNSQPIGNPQRAGAGPGHMMTNYYVNETDRGSINPTMVEQVNLRGNPRWNNLSYRDGARTTMKETNEFSYQGNPNIDDKAPKFYTYKDVPKVTMKETNEFSYNSNPSKPDQAPKFYTYKDVPKVTMKETNEFSYNSNPNRPEQAPKFYTYADKPRPTIKQSVNYTYHSNPTRPDQAPRFYTYKDAPKPTVKQSTEYSYAGNLVSKDNLAETSRYQFTGPTSEKFANIDFNKLRGPDSPFNAQLVERKGGADTFTIRGTTLVTDYFPGAGRSNIQQDPEYLLGKVDFGTFGSDQNYTGPGTLDQALPDGSRMQNTRIMPTPHAAPNKLFGMDDRQLASYQVEHLKDNPLSIYTTNPNGEIPGFFANQQPDDFSPLVNASDNETKEILDSQPNPDFPKGGIGGLDAVNIYPPNADVLEINKENNPNMNIVGNLSLDSKLDFNRMIGQGSSRSVNSNPTFSGKEYSGQFGSVPNKKNPNDPVTLGGPDKPKVFGELAKQVPRQENDVGMINPTGDTVCKPNKALTFAGGDLMLL